MPVQQDQVVDVLKNVFDPEMPVDIWNFGLIYDVKIDDAGKVVRLTVPEMSEEQRNKLVARIKEMSEQTKVVIRNLRRDQLKKVEDAELTDDELERGKEEIQKILKVAETEIDTMFATKKKEILET